MNPTWRRGSPTRTGVRSSRIRDPGAKDFQEFSKDGTKNEKEPKKQTSGLWKMMGYGNPQKTWIPTALEKPAAFPHLHTGPAMNIKIMKAFKTRIVDFGRSKLRS